MGPGCGTGVVESGTACVYQCCWTYNVHNTCMSGKLFSAMEALVEVYLTCTSRLPLYVYSKNHLHSQRHDFTALLGFSISLS